MWGISKFKIPALVLRAPVHVVLHSSCTLGETGGHTWMQCFWWLARSQALGLLQTRLFVRSQTAAVTLQAWSTRGTLWSSSSKQQEGTSTYLTYITSAVLPQPQGVKRTPTAKSPYVGRLIRRPNGPQTGPQEVFPRGSILGSRMQVRGSWWPYTAGMLIAGSVQHCLYSHGTDDGVTGLTV